MIAVFCVEVKDKNDQIRIERSIASPFLDTGLLFDVPIEDFEQDSLEPIRAAVYDAFVKSQKVSPSDKSEPTK